MNITLTIDVGSVRRLFSGWHHRHRAPHITVFPLEVVVLFPLVTMALTNRSHYTAAFKRGVVLAAEQSSNLQAQQDLKVDEKIVSRWGETKCSTVWPYCRDSILETAERPTSWSREGRSQASSKLREQGNFLWTQKSPKQRRVMLEKHELCLEQSSK